MGDNEKELSQFNGHIKCEPPNNNLSRFEGRLILNEGNSAEKIIPLENDNILLRGTILRNKCRETVCLLSSLSVCTDLQYPVPVMDRVDVGSVEVLVATTQLV